jgi:hypothetical protein
LLRKKVRESETKVPVCSELKTRLKLREKEAKLKAKEEAKK